MTKIAEFGGYSYHVSGGYIPSVDQYHIRFDSQFTEKTRFPDELRKIAELNLSYTQLGNLIDKLLKIHNEPPHPPV